MHSNYRNDQPIHPGTRSFLYADRSSVTTPSTYFAPNEETPTSNLDGTVKSLYNEQSRDPTNCSLYGGVHPRESPRFSYSRFIFKMLFSAPAEIPN